MNIYVLHARSPQVVSMDAHDWLRKRRSLDIVPYYLFIDRIAWEIIRLVASVCVRVCPFAVGTLLFEAFDL